MKLAIIAFVLLSSSSYAYTLNLKDYAKYENSKCTLELGKKVYREAKLSGQSNVMAQDAVLITKHQQYSFEIFDREEVNNQDDFGYVSGEIFPTTINLEKTKNGSLKLKLVMENWQGWKDLLLDCGTLKLVK